MNNEINFEIIAYPFVAFWMQNQTRPNRAERRKAQRNQKKRKRQRF